MSEAQVFEANLDDACVERIADRALDLIRDAVIAAGGDDGDEVEVLAIVAACGVAGIALDTYGAAVTRDAFLRRFEAMHEEFHPQESPETVQ